MDSQRQVSDFRDVHPPHKLLVSAVLLLGQGSTAELQRGVMVKAVTGKDVGVVAAVVMDCSTREVTHVLLGEVPPTAVYRLIPLALIECMSEGALWLSIKIGEVSQLPCYQPA